MAADHHKASILDEFEWEILNMKGSLSQLLFSDDIILGGDRDTHFTHLNLLPPSNSPTMLCFENPKHDTYHKPNPPNPLPKATALKRKRDSVICPAKSPVGTSSKRMKLENSVSTSSRHAKTRRQGMGERIAALQQLVSPYGKTDTASVLDEAKGYIKFLQEQVRVLCSPYLQVSPSTPQGGVGSKRKKNLRSMGLCLVPVTCCSTLHVGSGNGADFWSPVTGINSSSSKCFSVPRL